MDPRQHPSPLIVFGAPRSGTTYLNGILNRHPQVFIAHETRLFAWLHRACRTLTRDEHLLLNHREESRSTASSGRSLAAGVRTG